MDNFVLCSIICRYVDDFSFFAFCKIMSKYLKLRENMVKNQIMAAGVIDDDVLSAFLSVPREVFAPEVPGGVYYSDGEISTGNGRHIMSPVLHARLIAMANPKKDDIVLDVACGSGYGSAVMSRLSGTTLALEADDEMLEHASSLWQKTESYNVVGVKGDLVEGAPAHAPFDVIFFNGAAETIPEMIVGQLARGGRLVAVQAVSGKNPYKAVRIVRDDAGNLSSQSLFETFCSKVTEFSCDAGFVL